MTRARLLLATTLTVLVALLGIGAALVQGASPAAARWSVIGSGTTTGTAVSLTRPAAPGATASSATAVALSGTLPTNPPSTTYAVQRGTTTVCSPTGAAGATWSCTDTGLTASTTYGYTVVATLAGWTSTSPVATATTPCSGPDTLVVDAPATAVAGTSFPVVVTAKTCAGVTDTTVTGSVTLSGLGTSPTGSAPAYGTLSLVGGTGSVTVTAKTAETATLTASVAGLTGTDVIVVGAAAPTSLAWVDPENANGNVTLSCAAPATSRACSQTSANGSILGRSWNSLVGLVDAYGNPSAATATTTVTLTYSYNGTKTSTVSIAAGATTSTTRFQSVTYILQTITVTAKTSTLTLTVSSAG